MKNKFFTFSLVLIVLIGIFSPSIKTTRAAGICIDMVTATIQLPKDKENCEAQGWNWEAPTDTDPIKVEKENTNYILLEPLPCEPGPNNPDCNPDTKLLEKFNPGGTGKLGEYLNFAIKLFIGLCAVAAVVMIVIGGIQYSASGMSPSGKGEAKERILGAVFGLVLALFSYLLLYTINPDLLNTDVDIGGATLTSEGELLAEELVEVVGPGIDINGQHIGIKKGGASPCVGGQVTIPSNTFNINPATSKTICNNLYSKLSELKSKVNFRITSTTTGKHGSLCHSLGNVKSGNCADLVPTGSTSWEDLCVAIASTGGMNFLNEGSSTPKCNAISPFRKTTHWSGYHLHVNYTGR